MTAAPVSEASAVPPTMARVMTTEEATKLALTADLKRIDESTALTRETMVRWAAERAAGDAENARLFERRRRELAEVGA